MNTGDLDEFVKAQKDLCHDSPLFSAVFAYAKSIEYRFHTPGHGGSRFFPVSSLMDVTEVSDLDSLFEAAGVILKAEEAAAEFFGAERTLFSAGGCTLCIQTMLALAVSEGGKAVFGRNCHRSAVNAAALLDIDPVFIMPEEGRIKPEDLRAVLLRNPDAQAVYVTSPDYYGRISDIASLARVCRDFNLPLLVDNAHGSHLILSGHALHPLKRGASMTACSAHKTLPVLTGGAWLNIADGKYADDAKSRMSLFGSSSPSYMTMASLDMARAWCKKRGKAAFQRVSSRVDEIKRTAVKKGFVFMGGETDPIRITLNAASAGYRGGELAELLRLRGIEPEYTDPAYVVLLPSLVFEEDAFSALEVFIGGLKMRSPLTVQAPVLTACERKLSLREALISSKRKTVDCKEALGKISGQILCPCPPGIPICLPGEIIMAEHIGMFLKAGMEKITIVP